MEGRPETGAAERGSFLARVPARLFIRLVLAASAAGAAALNRMYYVGYFNDDASFVLLARSLWEHLRELSGLGFGGAFSHFLPGYPLFLLPFAAAFAPHWAWLSWTSSGLSLLTVLGLWLLLDGWLPDEDRRWAVLLYAVHPLFLVDSGIVMADPFLTFLFVYGLLGLRLVLERGGALAWVLLIGTSFWAPASKPIGALLPAALTAGLAAAGPAGRRPLRRLLLWFWLPCAAAAVYFLLKRSSPTDYVGYLLHGLAALGGQPLWPRAYGLFHDFVLYCGLGVGWPRGGLWDLSGSAVIAGVLYFLFKGMGRLLAGEGPGRSAALAAAALLFAQGLVMSVWTVYSDRYALPMLPLALLFFAAGVRASWRARPAAGRALLALLAAGFAVHSAQIAAALHRSPRRENMLPARTMEWIRLNTPPASRFVGESPLVALYTGRGGDGLFGARDLDMFLERLSRSRIDYALVTDRKILSPKGSFENDQGLQKSLERGWIAGHPRLFRLLHVEDGERTAVYKVELPAGWDGAFVLYAGALVKIKVWDMAGAEKDLRSALAAVPDFPSALLALATVELVRGEPPGAAEKLLRRALELEPDYPEASRALAELLDHLGRRNEAASVRARASAARSLTPFSAPSR